MKLQVKARQLVTVGIALSVAYTILPYSLSRGCGFRVVKRVPVTSKVALTFDDGPDPVYTPRVLDLLRENSVKATFFVVGKKAEQHPDLIKRMHREGHQLGMHNYVHRSNWLMSPWKIRKGIEETANVIDALTGVRPTYYRPPWGMLTAYEFLRCRDLTIVLWSIMAEDWKVEGGGDKIKTHLARVTDGDIILLHDSDETFGAEHGAPENTISALKEVVPILKQNGLRFVRLDELVVRDPLI